MIRVGNGDAEEDWHQDLNPDTAAMQVGTRRLWVLPLPHGLGSRSDLAREGKG